MTQTSLTRQTSFTRQTQSPSQTQLQIQSHLHLESPEDKNSSPSWTVQADQAIMTYQRLDSQDKNPDSNLATLCATCCLIVLILPFGGALVATQHSKYVNPILSLFCIFLLAALCLGVYVMHRRRANAELKTDRNSQFSPGPNNPLQVDRRASRVSYQEVYGRSIPESFLPTPNSEEMGYQETSQRLTPLPPPSSYPHQQTSREQMTRPCRAQIHWENE